MYRPKIIIIDDERDLVALTGKRLQAAGYDVMCHHDGFGAIDVIEKTRPDIILLDIKLPHISGIDIFKEIRSNPQFNSIPVIFFSASAKDMDLCIENLKADGFVQKPYKSETLIDTLNRARANHQEKQR